MKNLSVVVSAFNEEKKVSDCLESIKDLADEIIFVDNTSTDKTVEIAKRYTSKIFLKPNSLMLNTNKNFGFSKAKGEWILSLDADERVTPELSGEIKSEIQNTKSEINGYWIPRKNILFGKWIQHAGWYPDRQLRLFRKMKGRFEEKHVHEMIKVEGKTSNLSHELLHHNYETIQQFLHKHVVIYAPNEANELLRKGYEFQWQDSMRFPFKEFISRFFAREGYKEGLHGLVLSLGMAFYHFIIFVYIWEKRGFPKLEYVDLLEGSKKEIRSFSKEFNFWFENEKIKATKNIFLKRFRELTSRLRI